MKKNITTLEELEKEQEKLKMTMELTKEAFVQNIATNRYQLKDFLVKKIALPGGVIGLGYAAVKKMVAVAGAKKEQKKVESSSSDISEKVLPIALSVAQAYFFKQWRKETVKKETRVHPTETNTTHRTLKKVV